VAANKKLAVSRKTRRFGRSSEAVMRRASPCRGTTGHAADGGRPAHHNERLQHFHADSTLQMTHCR
jgi:hypothetical protein